MKFGRFSSLIVVVVALCLSVQGLLAGEQGLGNPKFDQVPQGSHDCRGGQQMLQGSEVQGMQRRGGHMAFDEDLRPSGMQGRQRSVGGGCWQRGHGGFFVEQHQSAALQQRNVPASDQALQGRQ